MPADALTPKDIAQIAFNAGFRGEALTIATAVAMAESGGRPTAQGDVGLQNATWGPSVGLWQVRSLNGAPAGSSRDANANADPSKNASSAYEISGGGSNFHPWSTYTNGAYTRYLSVAQQAADGISTEDTINPMDQTDAPNADNADVAARSAGFQELLKESGN